MTTSVGVEATARNARLHLGSHAGATGLPRVLRPARIPPAPWRALQRLAAKAGRMDWERRWLAPLTQARTSAGLAGGPPRFLVRVDEFPYASAFDQPDRYGLEASRRFHAIMADAGVAHLMAVVPQLTQAPLDPHATGERPLNGDERALIERMRADGVTFAQHGTTHRTRHAAPRRRSEFVGLEPARAAALLDRGRGALEELDVRPRVFVAPFNRFSAAHWDVLSERFDVICGGPESVPLLGWHGGPLWRGDAIYLPCYAPMYAGARELLAVTERMIDLAPGTWIPLVMHMGWEADDGFAALQRLAPRLAAYAASWDEFLLDIDRSREARGVPLEAGARAMRSVG